MNPADFIYLDIQTTGIRPPAGRPLEIAWAIGLGETRARLVALPENMGIPRAVSMITGLADEDLKDAPALEDVHAELARETAGAKFAVIHYATFEKPFLNELFAGPPPFEILCSYKIAKRLLPNMPSLNLKALSGYFGKPFEDGNRAGPHVEATRQVWLGLLEELKKLGIETPQAIAEFQNAKAPKREKIEYRLEKLKRLELPKDPGVYRMLDKNGRVLYVGKATSLKSRVNSYFRGQKKPRPQEARDARPSLGA